MWRPRTYEEASAAVGVVSESADLDFKSDLGTTERAKAELAKDVAAMTIVGGVIVIGIAETDGLASAVKPIPLAGEAERIQQIIDSRVRPPVAIEIDELRPSPSDTEGLIVIEVPASRLAPHYANEKFPRRSGRVTDYMTEREIELLYEQRQRLREAKEGAGPQATYVNPEASQGSRQGGMGVLRLLVHPLGEISVTGSPRLEEPLTEAVVAARSAVDAVLAETLKSFDWLAQWSPRGTIGWKAGHASDEFADHGDQVFVAATYSYTGQLSFRVSMSLDVPKGPPRRAFEHLWAGETVALLSIAGHLYREIPGVGLVRVALFLDGLDGTIASTPVHDASVVTVTDGSYTESLITSPRLLAADPVAAARQLLDRLFISFVDHRIDVFSRITR